MRVCFISRRYFPAVSGMSVYARNLTRALSERGHEVVMISQYRNDETGVRIYGGGPPPDEAWMEVHGLRSVGEERGASHGMADFEADLREMVGTALKLHAEKPFDVVHGQYAYPTGLAAMEVSRQLGIPNVVSIQGGDGHWVGLCCETHRRAMEAVLDHSMALVIGCDSFRDEVVENHGTEPKHFTIIPGATNTDQFVPRQKALGELRTPARLLYHGRVDSRKGSLDFVRMGKLLVDRGHDIELVVSGIGPDFLATEQLARELGMDGQTYFPGEVSYAKAPLRYHGGDIFLSPTYAEGFSNTILEAMACGLPIVSTLTVGVIDCIRSGQNGLLVEAGDLNALADATERLLTEGDLRKRLAETAHAEVRSTYSWPVVAKQFEVLYNSLLEREVPQEWTSIISTEETVASADPTCRFRAEPHLL